MYTCIFLAFNKHLSTIAADAPNRMGLAKNLEEAAQRQEPRTNKRLNGLAALHAEPITPRVTVV
jgi:hypothetical protein